MGGLLCPRKVQDQEVEAGLRAGAAPREMEKG